MCVVDLHCCKFSICAILFSANQLAQRFSCQFQSASPFVHLNKVCGIHCPYRSRFCLALLISAPLSLQPGHVLLFETCLRGFRRVTRSAYCAFCQLHLKWSLLLRPPRASYSHPSVLQALARTRSYSQSPVFIRVLPVPRSLPKPHSHAAPASCRPNPFIRSRPLLYVREEHVDI